MLLCSDTDSITCTLTAAVARFPGTAAAAAFVEAGSPRGERLSIVFGTTCSEQSFGLLSHPFFIRLLASSSDSANLSMEELYVVEAIVAHKGNGPERHYLVQWKGEAALWLYY